jgi:hypothetical protein
VVIWYIFSCFGTLYRENLATLHVPPRRQGDRIGRIFAQWVVGSFLKITEAPQIVGLLFSINFTKMGGATFWGNIFSYTHLVTLHPGLDASKEASCLLTYIHMYMRKRMERPTHVHIYSALHVFSVVFPPTKLFSLKRKKFKRFY